MCGELAGAGKLRLTDEAEWTQLCRGRHPCWMWPRFSGVSGFYFLWISLLCSLSFLLFCSPCLHPPVFSDPATIPHPLWGLPSPLHVTAISPTSYGFSRILQLSSRISSDHPHYWPELLSLLSLLNFPLFKSHLSMMLRSSQRQEHPLPFFASRY